MNEFEEMKNSVDIFLTHFTDLNKSASALRGV